MADALDDVITEITTLMAAMTGINQAPENPPENVNDPPMVVTYHVRCFDISYNSGYTRTMHTIHCDVLLARAVLPHVEPLARSYILRGIETLAQNITLNSDATHCYLTEIIGPGAIPYAGDTYFGVRYILEIKLTQKDLNLTVSA